METRDGMQSPWRGLRRFAAWSALNLFALAAVWACWYELAAGRFNRELAAIRSRGEATTRDEMVEALGQGKSGYDLATEACGALLLDADESELVSPMKGPGNTPLPLDEKQMALGQRMLGENAKVLRILDDLPAAKWQGYPVPASLIVWSAPGLGRIRGLANFLRMAALVHHSMGDEEAAADDLQKIEWLARVLDDGPVLIHQLVAMAVRSVGEDGWLEIAPDLQLQNAGHPHGLDRERWQREIERCQEKAAPQRGFAKGFVGERAEMLATEAWAERNVPHLVPMLRLDATRTCARYSRLIEAIARGRDYETTLAICDWPRYRSNVMSLAHSIEMDQFITRNVIKLHFRTMCNGDGTAIRLALRLYQVDHGSEAGRLADLVPAYLKKVPVDLFRSDGGAWTYSLKKREFWSVNDNGIDDGGDVKYRYPGQPVDWNDPDGCFWLDRMLMAPATTAK
ncbi:MAG: hypothetical protein ACTHN5_14590 [Phycisphaerae bacterium]